MHLLDDVIGDRRFGRVADGESRLDRGDGVDGVYWKPIYYGLEGIVDELWLVNAAHVKRVPGR